MLFQCLVSLCYPQLSLFVSWWPVTTVNSSAAFPTLSIFAQNLAAGNKLIVTSPVRHSSPTFIFLEKFRIECQRKFERMCPPCDNAPAGRFITLGRHKVDVPFIVHNHFPT